MQGKFSPFSKSFCEQGLGHAGRKIITLRIIFLKVLILLLVIVTTCNNNQTIFSQNIFSQQRD